MEIKAFNQSLLSFLQASPTPFHATENMGKTLLSQGFKPLLEGESWQIEQGGKYFVTRNDSSIIAFTTPQLDFDKHGWRMLGAHTDSPCLKLKPNQHVNRAGYDQLGVEVYGGVLRHTWLDRDLSLAGRVTFKNKAAQILSRLINFQHPIAVIPNLAIHLNREINNEGFKVNPQEELLPVLGTEDSDFDLSASITKQLEQEHSRIDVDQILDFELSL